MKMKPKKYTKIISNYHNSKLNTLPTYNEWNDISNNYDTLIEIGLIAQDIKKIPLYKDIVTTEEYDICGNINLISLNYNNILTTNISALQEVYNQLQSEKTETSELEQNVKKIEMSVEVLIKRIETLEKL